MLGRMVSPPLGLPAGDPSAEGRVWTEARVDTDLALLAAVTAWRRGPAWHADVDRLLDLRLQLTRTS